MLVLNVRVQVEGSDVIDVGLEEVPRPRGPVEWTEQAIAHADIVASAILGRCDVRVEGHRRLYRGADRSGGWAPVAAG